MRLLETFYHQNNPDTYTFVFDEIHDTGDYTTLVIPDAPDWPYSPFRAGQYDPDGANERLGERTTLRALGEVILTRFFTRLRYQASDIMLC